MHRGASEKHQVWPNGDSAGETRTDPPGKVSAPICNPRGSDIVLKAEDYRSFLDIYDLMRVEFPTPPMRGLPTHSQAVRSNRRPMPPFTAMR